MPREPIRVEVVCHRCSGSGKDPTYGGGGVMSPGSVVHFVAWPCLPSAGGCGGSGRETRTLLPDSYAARQIELAVAALDRSDATREYIFCDEPAGAPIHIRQRFNDTLTAYQSALKAVREHPDHPALTGEGE